MTIAKYQRANDGSDQQSNADRSDGMFADGFFGRVIDFLAAFTGEIDRLSSLFTQLVSLVSSAFQGVFHRTLKTIFHSRRFVHRIFGLSCMFHGVSLLLPLPHL